MKPEDERMDAEGLEAFEKRLMRVPLRGVPDGIQAETLASLRDLRMRRPREEARRGATGLSVGWLRELLWPNPKAWGCVAIGWVAIAVAQLSLPTTISSKAPVLAQPSRSHSVDRESLQRVREQRELLARLLTPPAPAPAARETKLVPQILYWRTKRHGNGEDWV